MSICFIRRMDSSAGERNWHLMSKMLSESSHLNQIQSIKTSTLPFRPIQTLCCKSADLNIGSCMKKSTSIDCMFVLYHPVP